MRLHGKNKSIATIAFVGLLSFACSSDDQALESHVDGLAATTKGKNVAVLFGAANDLPGIDDDVNMLKNILQDERAGYGFDVRSQFRPSRSKIFEMTRQAARDVGPNGTLLWYFSGHGAQSGTLIAEGRVPYTNDGVNFDDIAKAIREVRDTPLKRLTVIIDACYSGQMVDGRLAIGRQGTNVYGLTEPTMAESVQYLTDAMGDEFIDGLTGQAANYADEPQAASNGLAKEILVVSASSRNNTSLAGSNGSVFTKALYDTFRAQSGSNTMKDLMDGTHERTVRGSRQHHRPYYRAVPESIMSRPVLQPEDDSDDQIVDPNRNDNGNDRNNPDAPSIGADIYLALAANGGQATESVFVAGSARVAKAMLCRGGLETCKAEPKSVVSLRVDGSINGRPMFKATDFTPVDGNTYTIIGLNGSDAVVEARALTISRQ